ncbi:MAG: MBOAT family protein, partial [Myxococcota bacterium]
MLFNSLEYALFLATCFVLHALLPQRLRNALLLAASYLFYAAWDWRFLALILASTGVDFLVGRALESRPDEPVRRRQLLGVSLAANLGLLGTFKYAGFFVESFLELAAAVGVHAPEPLIRIVLPVGISFYTFQTLSYTIDVYRRRTPATRNLLDFALFVAFFPQLVAGPIERAGRLLPQMRKRRLEIERIAAGGWLLLWGTYKKVVVADNLAPLVEAVYAPGASPAAGELAFASVAFALQIYCDFSGYTDIARGSARLFGFELMLNFRLPYLATSPRDFWRRWHISLSTWLRDYLYIPLGGNRSGRIVSQRNLMITMLLGGLWHGAAWNFVLWGGYHGGLLAVHRALLPVLERIRPGAAAARAAWWTLRVAATFLLVLLGWVLFRVDSLGHLGALLASAAASPELGQVGSWLPIFAVVALPL